MLYADGSRRKIQETIDIFVQERLYEKYHQLYVLVLTRKQQRYSPFRTWSHFSFDSGKHILDIGDLIEVANTLPAEKLGQIADFLERETRSVETNPRKRAGVTIGSWVNYLCDLLEHHREWHIPSELRPLITWNVPPVAIDDYMRLAPTFERSFLPDMRKQVRSDSVPSLRLSEVVAKTPVLIMGSAGAGKSTCLRSLCNGLAAEAKARLERENSWDGTKVPVLVTLRRYGPVRLQELIRSHLHYRHSPVTHKHLERLLEDNRFIFLLDGLDEVQRKWRDDLVNEIVALHQTYPDHSIIVTTRKQPHPPFLNGFEIYEIRPLEQEAILAFAKAYLGSSHLKFLHQIEERGIEDLLRVPLLLTLCLIVFRSERTAFDSLAGVYTKIVELYKANWECPGRPHRVDVPLDWSILEKTLAKLAYRMVADGNTFSFSREALLEFLKDIVAGFDREHLWSYNHTIYDLMDQLLTHNFLDMLGNEVSFWHSSFRDFFAARLVAELPTEQILELATSRDWALVTPFLGGLLPDSRPVREGLVEVSLKGETLDETYWPIETLGLMGNETTTDILRAISEPSYMPVHMLARNILRNRRFKGVQIFDYVSELLWMIDEVSLGNIGPGGADEWMPGFTNMDIEAFRSFYEQTMLALSEGNVDDAQRHEKRLTNYFESLTEPQRKLDQWLLSKGVNTIDDFRYGFNRGHFSEEDLLDFCRNTLLESSLPFLETVFLATGVFCLRTEAHLAIQSIIRSRMAPYNRN